VKEFARLASVEDLVQALELAGKRIAVELNGKSCLAVSMAMPCW
jgi:sulfur carrier protein ThiS